jgi:putative membrane protein
MTTEPVPERIRTIERPHPALWTYYITRAILTGPGLVILLPYLYFRYHTLRYRFDEEGIHMKVGILFRRETNLTYSRIQDIHLRSGILQRWLGLANVQIQTASGSSGPELVIEGFKDYETIRDFLYTRMRGYQTHSSSPRPSADQIHTAAIPTSGGDAEMVSLLLGIRDELRRTRELLEARSLGSRPSQSQPPQPQPPPHV